MTDSIEQGTVQIDSESGTTSSKKKTIIPIPKGLCWKFQKPESQNQESQSPENQKPKIENPYIKLAVPEGFSEFDKLVSTAIKSDDADNAIDNTIKDSELWRDASNLEMVSYLAKRYASFNPFIFELERLQDKDTNEETLVILCRDGGRPKGKIETNLIDLQSDIKEFQRYGIALQDVEFFAIAAIIKREYMRIKAKTIDINSDDEKENIVFNTMLSLGECIYNGSVELKNDLYLIPVSDFNSLLEQIGIRKYRFNAVRRLLVDRKYIVRGVDNISVTCRSKDKGKKVYRALAFSRDMVKDYCDINGIKLIPDKPAEGTDDTGAGNSKNGKTTQGDKPKTERKKKGSKT